MKNRKIYIFISLMIVFFMFTPVPCSYSKVLIRDGKEYGKIKGAFRNRWWNYYERGLSYLEGEFYQEAIADFKNALKQRAEDKRMARTYGMHFIDYFPNREMGLAYYLSGDYDNAEKYIETSMGQQPSAKARFYYDKILKHTFLKKNLPPSTPGISVDLERDVLWTNADPIIISGYAEDDRFISKLKIAGKKLFIEAAQKKIDFKENLKLEQGRHDIEITAARLILLVFSIPIS